MTAIEIVTVPHADNMSDEVFQQHFNFRHSDSLGGLERLATKSRNVLIIYRTFHRKLHDWRIGYDHEHLPYEKP